ncbi:XK-related protein 8-like [Seriola lalandi dorsalis]|uniref:XK-related protein n=1 Tax=Seriola lalandi dorsalis TaxID=1841481 RepID=A0A3B4X3J0_SERLL|nr:XK-related protein 8-like [Seriola lalandi dorsalis]XP_056255295.1 XK-related protein 8-like [Seriola aureovittata]
MSVFQYNRVDFFFTCLGLVFLLLDIGLDIFAAVSFYQEKAYVSLSILLLFLVGSSVLVQAYSWLWYSYEDFERQTKVESCLTLSQLRLLHWLQLGIYFRHAGVVEVSIRSFCTKMTEGCAVYLSHDLSMLRLIETFSESSPQLVLMLTIILQRGELDPVTVLKALGSASAIAFSVTTYHRSLRSFLPEKEKQQIVSSVIYFLWNLFLISSRLTSLALFASVLPCFMCAHFFCSWLLLLFFVWRCKTDFMESPVGEWLYRATVGLIWYFNWFNVVEGKTRFRTLLYHGFIVADVSLLCGLWCWRMNTEELYFEIPHTVIAAVSVVSIYLFGLLLKIIYYKCYHPNLSKEELKGVTSVEELARSSPLSGDEVDSGLVSGRSFPSPPAPDLKHNKRMRKLAENFYS